ncbi:ABC transporter substrate-binding protein [Cohnella lupini]|uniref:Carbohydrate ABC transporter substrate-binding protein (CUT1 family) n=1 Tax=Cohnella lupini TaxID=1294267 RepID=A0A3D9IJF3_9BACL|nr:extracellular solute-binding protein [Cohnella lupini]RED61831.1 carbohydrate ABC transporter substrate-binding protein (CUT1 family) [Cohnella lupini]
MRNKKGLSILSTAIALTIFTGLLAGCGSNNNKGAAESSQSASTASASASPTESASPSATEIPKQDVTISLTAASGDTWIRPIDQEIIADFTKETGIKVDVQIAPADQYAGVLKAKLAAGEGADISLIWPEANAAQFLPDTNFLDLSNEPWVSTLTDAAKRNGTFNGKFIGWNPEGENAGWGIMYNKDIFSSLGLEVPKTFDDLVAVSEKIKASGVTPIYEPLKDSWHSGIWFALMGPIGEKNNAGLMDKLNQNTASYADVPEFETFLTQYKTLYDNGYFGKDAFSNTWDKGIPTMQSGKYAMFMVPSNMDVQSKAQYPEFDFAKFGEFPTPLADNRSLAVYDGTIIRVINKNSKHIDAAKQYLSYISRPDVLDKYYAASGLNPAFKALPAIQADLEKSLRANSDGTVNTTMETGIQFWDSTAVGNYVQELLAGKKTPKQVLEAIDNDRKKIFTAQAQ